MYETLLPVINDFIHCLYTSDTEHNDTHLLEATEEADE